VYLHGGWYTVVVTDANGCSISDSVLVDVLGVQQINSSSILLYPNPTQGTLNFSSIVKEVLVLDMQGRLLLKQEACDLIDVTLLAAGQYQLLYNNGQGTELLHFVKQ